MKKKLLLLPAIAAFILCSSQKINAQSADAATAGGGGSWKLSGNGGTNPATNFVGTTDANPLIFRTNNVEKMRIIKSGKVGIGVINPTAKLNVASDAYVTLSSSGYLMLGYDTSVNMGLDHNVIQARNNGAASAIYLNYYGGNTYLGPGGAVQITGSGNNITGNTILNGTATINGAATVNSNILLNGNLNFSGNTQSIQFANPGSSPAPMMYMLQSGTANNPRMVIAHSPSYPDWGLQYTDANDQFDFLGAGISRMTIALGSGNVGIGVTSPVYKLEVCGTIRAKEVRVETGWCDYVFEKDYKLRSLNDLEKYINDNKHLPGIAPASEVEKDGLKVAEMNKAMMEKIEELTLYVIQLSKDNKKLQQEVDALKK